MRKLRGLFCRAQERFIQTLLRLFFCVRHAAKKPFQWCAVWRVEGVESMDITTFVRTLSPLADAFEVYGIPYHLTGSLALSVYVKTQDHSP
jgi:hypothetical protein